MQQQIPVEQVAQAALNFIDRAQIAGSEAESMVLVKSWLRSIAQPQPKPEPKPQDTGPGEKVTPIRSLPDDHTAENPAA